MMCRGCLSVLAGFLVQLVAGCGQQQPPEDEQSNGSASLDEVPPSPAPWTETVDGFECTHPPVEPDCEDGWCRIPAGCFMMGSPEDEVWRGAFTEELTPVVLTHDLLVQRTELTQEQWLDVVGEQANTDPLLLDDKEYSVCGDTDCPVGNVSWYEAVAYANLLSEQEGYEPCYELSGCSGTLGAGPSDPFTCEGSDHTTGSIYECGGYRLPTEPEHEYFVRAGTRTTYFTGDLDVDRDAALSCDTLLPHLDLVAWYCANSMQVDEATGKRVFETHPVANKEPNQWGLYDVLGNAQEWNNSRPVMPSDGEPPWIDPQSGTGNGLAADRHLAEGGNVGSPPAILRVPGRGTSNSASQYPSHGFRLVRTLDP